MCADPDRYRHRDQTVAEGPCDAGAPRPCRPPRSLEMSRRAIRAAGYSERIAEAFGSWVRGFTLDSRIGDPEVLGAAEVTGSLTRLATNC